MKEMAGKMVDSTDSTLKKNGDMFAISDREHDSIHLWNYIWLDWLVVWNILKFCFFHILGMSSSQLTNSYFPEG
jgi:hypothetical protein